MDDDDESGSIRTPITLLVAAVIVSVAVMWSGLVVPYDGYEYSGWLLLSWIVGVLALPILLGAALVRRLWIASVGILMLSIVAVSIALGGEAIRWRWSESELTSLAMDPSRWGECGSMSPCRVGWWKVGDVESVGSGVYMQSPTAASGCEMGGLLLADGTESEAILEERLREMFPSFSAQVRPYRGSWLTACLYS